VFDSQIMQMVIVDHGNNLLNNQTMSLQTHI